MGSTPGGRPDPGAAIAESVASNAATQSGLAAGVRILGDDYYRLCGGRR